MKLKLRLSLFLAATTLGLANCGDHRSSTQKENPPGKTKVEIEIPPLPVPVPPAFAQMEITARLDNSEAGASSYWLQVDWNLPAVANVEPPIAWGFLLRHGKGAEWQLPLDHPTAFKNRWYYHPFRIELEVGKKHTIEMRAAVSKRSDHRDSRLKCPANIMECPVVKIMQVDLSSFEAASDKTSRARE